MAPRNSSDAKLVPAAGYIRMSTDRQEDSPERQRVEINSLAKREGYRIVCWYEDHGKTGTKSANRPQFQKLLVDASRGEFKAVLVHEASRLSRESLFDVVGHWKTLSTAGVHIVTTRRGRIDFSDIGSVLTAIIDVHGARDESIKLADRTTGGVRLAIERGQKLGVTPFGFDREVYDENNQLVKTVSFRQAFRKSLSWRTKLVPSSDVEAVEAVRFMFAKVAEGWSTIQVTKHFNATGLKPRHAEFWHSTNIKSMLTNRAYCGDITVGRRKSKAQFSKITPEPYVKHDQHEGLVSRELFDKVQMLMASRGKWFGKRDRQKAMLAGILRCDCGSAMTQRPRSKGNTTGTIRDYVCSAERTGTGCLHPSVRVDWLEDAVLNVVKNVLTGGDAIDRIGKSVRRKMASAKEDPTAKLEVQINALRAKIDRATRNVLELEDVAAVRTINKAIADLRAQEGEIIGKLAAVERTTTLGPEARQALAALPKAIDRLANANREKLAQALSLTIKQITIAKIPMRKGRRRHLKVAIEFRSGTGEVESVVLDHEDICPRRKWFDTRDIVLEAYPRVVQNVDIAKRLKRAPTQVSRELKLAVEDGWIREKDGGYVAVKPRKPR